METIIKCNKVFFKLQLAILRANHRLKVISSINNLLLLYSNNNPLPNLIPLQRINLLKEIIRGNNRLKIRTINRVVFSGTKYRIHRNLLSKINPLMTKLDNKRCKILLVTTNPPTKILKIYLQIKNRRFNLIKHSLPILCLIRINHKIKLTIYFPIIKKRNSQSLRLKR